MQQNNLKLYPKRDTRTPVTPAAVETTAEMSAPENPSKQNGGAPAKRHEEYQYLDLVREILETGEHRPDR